MTINERAPEGDRSWDAVKDRLQMPLGEAMMTQRAVRRVLPDPVDDDLVVHLIEHALRAPTGSNGQNWEFVVVKDEGVKAGLAKRYRESWGIYGAIGRKVNAANPSMLKVLDAVQWQVDNFERIPVLVIPCLKGSRAPFVPMPPFAPSSYYGSIYPSVQNLLLAARAVGLGASLITLPLWTTTYARKLLGLPISVLPACVVPMGWPQGRYGPTTRRPVGDVTHLDRYGVRPWKA